MKDHQERIPCPQCGETAEQVFTPPAGKKAFTNKKLWRGEEYMPSWYGKDPEKMAELREQTERELLPSKYNPRALLKR